MVFNLERQSANAFFADPVNSVNETIMLTGNPQVQGLNGDVYYWLNMEGDTVDSPATKNKANPVIGIVSDTFWLFNTGKLVDYEIALSWNECLQKNFPDVYRRLMAQQQVAPPYSTPAFPT
jgi:hypothetical protein